MEAFEKWKASLLPERRVDDESESACEWWRDRALELEARLSTEAIPPVRLDGKFGIREDRRIVNLVSGEAIPEDEPLFLLRARDSSAYWALRAYRSQCIDGGCNELHLAGIAQTIDKFYKFAQEHPERMKQPGITKHLKLEAEAKLTPEAIPRGYSGSASTVPCTCGLGNPSPPHSKHKRGCPCSPDSPSGERESAGVTSEAIERAAREIADNTPRSANGPSQTQWCEQIAEILRSVLGGNNG